MATDRRSINAVLAQNLAAFMRDQELTQMSLATRAQMGQSTVSLYLSPDRRAPGKTGKEPSAKLSEVARLADALGVDVWQLLAPPGSPGGLDAADQRFSLAAIELAQRFDEVPAERKRALYALLLDEIRRASTDRPPAPDELPMLSRRADPKTVPDKSRA